MRNAAQDITETKSAKIGRVIDHLVDALGSDPCCTLRRAVILADIDENPGTTQTEIMDRLGVQKSCLSRDVEWLYDYGCVMRQQDPYDARVIRLHCCGYSKKNLGFALENFNFSHKNLKNFLIGLINLFGEHKPTLRDAKIVAVLGDEGSATKQEIFEGLYNGPSTTQNRAINNLVDFGIVHKKEERLQERETVQNEITDS